MGTNENEVEWLYNHSKSLGYSKSSPKKEIHCNTSIPQKIGKNSNTQGNLASKGAGEKNSK